MKKGILSALTASVLSLCIIFSACNTDASNGMSAYDIAVKNGFKGTEQQWLGSLKGEKGDPGEKGEKGDKGDSGIRGSKWFTGMGNPGADLSDDLMEGDLYIDYNDGYIWSYKGNKWNALNISEDEFYDAQGLKEQLENGNSIILRNDISLSENDILNIASDKTVDLDLGGMTLDYGGSGSGDLAGIKVSGTLTISNGTINFASSTTKSGFSQTSSPIIVEEGATLTLNDVDFISTTTSGILAKADSTVNINDSRITTMAYCIGTNASASGYGAPESINIKGSTLISSNENGDSTPVLVNVATNLNISDSTIKGDRQAVILRGCNAVIENSTLESTGKFALDESGSDSYLESDWKSGNEVPYATLVIGNRGAGYQYPTTVTLKKVTLITPDTKNSATDSDNSNQGSSETDNNTNTGSDNSESKDSGASDGTQSGTDDDLGKNINNGDYNANYMRYNGKISISYPDTVEQNLAIVDESENTQNADNKASNSNENDNKTAQDEQVDVGDESTQDKDLENDGMNDAEEESVTVLPLYVYGNTEDNGVTLTMDEFTEAQAGKKFIFSDNVTYHKDAMQSQPNSDSSAGQGNGIDPTPDSGAQTQNNGNKGSQNNDNKGGFYSY